MPFTFPKLPFVFFVRTVLIQDPAHADKLLFTAMALTRRVAFKVSFTHVCRRMSVQVDGSKVGAVITQIQSTGTDRLACRICSEYKITGMHTSSHHFKLPHWRAAAVGQRRLFS